MLDDIAEKRASGFHRVPLAAFAIKKKKGGGGQKKKERLLTTIPMYTVLCAAVPLFAPDQPPPPFVAGGIEDHDNPNLIGVPDSPFSARKEP